MGFKYIVPSRIENLRLDKKKSIMLGHWCANYQPNKKRILYNNILNHPWNNRLTFEKDFIKIQNLYEKNLINLKNVLNKNLKKNYSLRFWRILIGPWLNLFLTLFFEKEILIKKFLKLKKIKLIKFQYIRKNFITSDHLSFFNISATDEWHYYFFLDMLENYERLNDIKNINYETKKTFIKKPNFIHKKQNFFSNIKTLNHFNKNLKVIFFDTYLSKKEKIYLSLKNFQFFKLNFPKIYLSPEPNIHLREKIIKKNITKNFPNSILFRQILLNIPINYLENFNQIGSDIKNSNLPLKPKVVFTTNGLYLNPLKSRYVAELIEGGTKLVHGQHGGNYGNLKQNFFENHEIKIADYYLTWGWKNRNNKIKNFGVFLNFEKINRKTSSKRNLDKILIVTILGRRYLRNLQSLTTNIAERHNYLYKFLPKIIEKIKLNLRKKIIVRTYDAKPSLGWNFKPFLKNKFKNIEINGKPDRTEYEKLINKSKIVVVTVFSTVFFECLLANVPTILVLPASKRIFNQKTIKFINMLERENIYFSDTNSAAKFINNNWNNIDNWWYNNKTQEVIKIFTKAFAKKNANLIFEIQKLFEKLKKNEKI